MVKNPPANAGATEDVGLIPGWGRSSGGGNGNSLQYSYLGSTMDRGARWATVHEVAESQTWPSHWAHKRKRKRALQEHTEVRSRGLQARPHQTPLCHHLGSDSPASSTVRCKCLLFKLPGLQPQLRYREGNGTPLQYSCLGNPMDKEDWWTQVHGVAKSQTQLSN